MKPGKELMRKSVTLPRRALTSAEFSQLEDVPPETEWFANIDNPHTRRAYRNDLKEFMSFAGIRTPTELRLITRAHVIAWRKDLDARTLAPGSIRRKMSALSSTLNRNAISRVWPMVTFASHSVSMAISSPRANAPRR